MPNVAEEILIRTRPKLSANAGRFFQDALVRLRTVSPPADVLDDLPDAYTTETFTTSGRTITVPNFVDTPMVGYRVVLIDSVSGVAQITRIVSVSGDVITVEDVILENYSWTSLRIIDDGPYFSIIIDTEEFDPQCMIPLSTVRGITKYWREDETKGQLERRDWILLEVYTIASTKRYVQFKFVPTLDAAYQSDLQQITLFRKP